MSPGPLLGAAQVFGNCRELLQRRFGISGNVRRDGLGIGQIRGFL